MVFFSCDCSYFGPLLSRLSIYIMSFYMQPRGLNLKQRQRQDTDGLSCKLHLLTLEVLNITHNRCLTELNAFGEKHSNICGIELWRKILQQLNYHYQVIHLEIFMCSMFTSSL